MAWNKNNPAAGIVAKDLDNLIRTNNAGLEAGLDHDHAFETGVDTTCDHDRVSLNDAGGDEAGSASHLTIWNNAGVLKYRNATGAIRKISGDGDAIPAGTKMYFYANVAPTGWTIYNAVVDCLLAVKGGSDDYDATGGDGIEYGTWSQAGHAHTAPTTGDVTLTSAQSGVPAHTHLMKVGDSNPYVTAHAAFTGTANLRSSIGAAVQANAAANAASPHSHGGGGATAGSAEANTYRPLAAVGILATKDAY